MNNNEIENGILFNEDLVELNIKASTWDEVLSKLGYHLIKLNYVNSDFINAVIAREKEFPTGLKANKIGVAIPHTDVEFVNKPSIMIGVLKEPVFFEEMGSGNKIEVKVVFMLAMKKPKQQLNLLQKLIDIIQDEEILIEICNAKNRREVVLLIESILGNNIKE